MELSGDDTVAGEAAAATVPLPLGAPYRVAVQKTVIPEAPVGALERAGLSDRFDPVQRRLTVLMGPGGFGKTTLLAGFCRRARARGDRVVWFSADEQDDGARVVAHLAHAADQRWDVEQFGIGPLGKAEIHHLDGLLAAMRAEERPWVVAVDELERMPDNGARIIDHLIWRGPPNLHLALACREMPRSIDVATPVAEGRGIVLGPEELRFTLAEIGSFFGGKLPRERLRALWDASQGWPIAVCLQRNLPQADRTRLSDLSMNWVAARLLRGVAAADRRFVLEAACFEWADAQLLDEVLGVGSTERLRRLPILRGLVQGIEEGASFRLHPVIRRHADNELRALGVEHDIHRRMAVALAGRGHTVEAMRHALRAEDEALAGEICEAAGAVRLMLTGGLSGLRDALALLPRAVVDGSPRLELARLATRGLTGPAATSTTYTRLLPPAADGRETAGADELRQDMLVVGGLLLMCGCHPIAGRDTQTAFDATTPAVARADLDPAVAGGLWYGRSVYHYQTGVFDEALAEARRVREFAAACPSAAVAARILEGAILIARGDAEEAETVLVQAQGIARREFAGHESPEHFGNVFAAELALERRRFSAARRRVPSLEQLSRVGAWLDAYAAAIEVQLELALAADTPTRAMRILEQSETFARSRRLQTLVRWLFATRVTVLIRSGRVAEGSALWGATELPAADGRVRGERRTWRELEALLGAGVRLRMARGEHGAALALGRAFAADARDRGWARSESLATALCVRAAWLAGDTAAACAAVVENLRLYRRTGFSRALTEDSEVAAAVLRQLTTDDAQVNAAREDVLKLLAESGRAVEHALSKRETEILVRLERMRDKEIARELGITDNGVRYHTKKIFRKLGVSNRREAAQRARTESLGAPAPSDGPC